VTGFNLFDRAAPGLTKGITVTLEAGTWFYTYIDVPAGFTNLSIFATNLPPPSTPPLQLYLNYGVRPDFSNYLESVWLTNGVTTPGIPFPTARRSCPDGISSAFTIPTPCRTS